MFRLKDVLHANFLVLATELAWTPFTNRELLGEKNKTFPLPQIKTTELHSNKRKGNCHDQEGIAICF